MAIEKDAAVSGDVFPEGCNDFEELIITGRVYVDKTSYLEDLLNSGTEVAQIQRPRRFGKTLTMSMLSCFLEMNYQHPGDRSRPERLFKDLAISKNKAFCAKHMGRYPVISLSFKNADGETFHDAVKAIIRGFAGLSDKFAFLARRDDLDTVFLQRIRDLNTGKARVFRNDGNFESSIWCLLLSFLGDLAKCLHQAFNKPPVIIIDDWDHPLQKATARGYYTDMIDIIQGILSAALKDSSDIFKGFITGVHHISYQSIYSGFNNYVESNITNESHAELMGFTKDETATLLKTLGMESRLPDVIDWYGGYIIAGNDMVCPRSVMEYLSRALNAEHDPAAFPPENIRTNSSSDDIIELSMKNRRWRSLERLQHLLEGKTEEIALRTFTSYPVITADTDFDTIATLMLHTGYLTVAGDAVPSARNRAVVRIPNKEVLERFSEKAKTLFSERNPEWLDKALKITAAFFAGEADKASDIIEDMLVSFISIRNTGYEYFYHGFMLGILSMTITNRMSMESNGESGNGFSDIVIKNSKTGKAVILEFRKCERDTPLETEKICREALKQIEINHYDQVLKKEYPEVFKYGIAFVKKGCRVIKA